MYTIRGREIISYGTDEDSRPLVKYDIDMDSSDDLTDIEFPARENVQGSIAHDISTGNFYSIDSAGTWYKQGGSE